MTRRFAVAAALTGAALSAAVLTSVAAGPADAAAPTCTGSQLVMGYKNLKVQNGHFAILMEFRNRGASTCTITGYPGFNAVDGSTLVKRAERTYQGYFGGSKDRTVPTVHLRPGHYASAIAEMYLGPNFPKTSCQTAGGFDFTPAGTGKTMHRNEEIFPCRLKVHPTAYGRAGQHG